MSKPSGVSDGTRPVELTLKIDASDGSVIYELVVPASEQASSGQCIDPWDPAKHRPKESLFPLRTDTGRTILWELNRPKLEPLPSLDAGATKKEIIAQLTNAMVNSKPGCPVTIEPSQNGGTDDICTSNRAT